MGYTSFYKGIAFVEGDPPATAKILKPEVKVQLSGIGSQLKSLDDVKEAFVNQCNLKTENAVVHFQYGQKAKFFSMEYVSFYGNGDLAELDYDTLSELHEKYD